MPFSTGTLMLDSTSDVHIGVHSASWQILYLKERTAVKYKAFDSHLVA